MTTSNKVSWTLAALLLLAVARIYFINEATTNNADLPVIDPPSIDVEFKSDDFPGAVATSDYKGTIQVNKLPAPFNVNGTMPYQVWVDGERVPLNSKQAREIIDALKLAKGSDFIQPENTESIHGGSGWLFPLPTVQ